MNTNQTLRQKALGLVFFLGPLLTILGAVAHLLGIGMSSFGDSWVFGIFQAYGFVCMIPIALELSRILGQRAPKLGLISAILGLCWAIQILPALARPMQAGMINAGMNESIWTILNAVPGVLFLMIPALLSIAAFLLLGCGFLWKGGLPRWSAGLLIVGSIVFYVAVLIGVANIEAILTILSHAAFLVALAPIGLRYLTGDSRASELEMATA